MMKYLETLEVAVKVAHQIMITAVSEINCPGSPKSHIPTPRKPSWAACNV